jgi:hypothetical protein
LVEHTLLVCVFLVCIKAVELLFDVLWTGDPLLLDRFRIRYFFEALDVGVLLVFAVGTLVTAIKVFVFRR